MKRSLLIFLIVFAFPLHAFAQKRTTILGDAWVGIVVTANETTREITLRHPDQSKNETFIGFLEDGNKIKMSEIEPGSRIRVFYKRKTREVGGQKVKAFVIHRIDFLGIDQYTRLRESLHLPAQISVAFDNKAKLPAKDPLRIFLALEQQNLQERFVTWVTAWNMREGAKYGRLEIVADLADSDVSLVSFWGRDELVAVVPIQISDQSGELVDMFPASLYLVTKEQDTLRVLWESPTFMPRDRRLTAEGPVEKEIAKRLKARTKSHHPQSTPSVAIAKSGQRTAIL